MKTRANARGTGGVAAVDRALEILGAFTLERGVLSLAELASKTGFYKSTILRLIETLIRHRVLLRLADGRYRIGPEALRLGSIYQRAHRVSDVLLPIMRELAAQCGESVAFHIREGDARICLHRVESSHAIRYDIAEGATLPLEVGAGGRVLSAFAGSSGGIEEPYETIRRTMYYASFGEREPDTAGLSAPVFGPGQTLAGALTIAGPTSRMDQRFLSAHVGQLLGAAARATRDLGGDPAGLEAAAKKTGEIRG